MKPRIWNGLAAVAYLMWAALHIQAGVKVTELAAKVPHGMPQGRVYQDAFLLFVAAGAVLIGALQSLRGISTKLYWFNLTVASVSDLSFIFFVLVPGYIPPWPGIQGPALWIVGAVLSTVAITLAARQGGKSGPPMPWNRAV